MGRRFGNRATLCSGPRASTMYPRERQRFDTSNTFWTMKTSHYILNAAMCSVDTDVLLLKKQQVGERAHFKFSKLCGRNQLPHIAWRKLWWAVVVTVELMNYQWWVMFHKVIFGTSNQKKKITTKNKQEVSKHATWILTPWETVKIFGRWVLQVSVQRFSFVYLMPTL